MSKKADNAKLLIDRDLCFVIEGFLRNSDDYALYRIWHKTISEALE